MIFAFLTIMVRNAKIIVFRVWKKSGPPICYFSIAKRHLNGNKKVANIGLSTQSNVALHNQSQIGYTLCKNCDDNYFATFLLPFATFLLPK